MTRYLPSPADVPPVHAKTVKGGEDVTVVPAASAPLAALAFKVCVAMRVPGVPQNIP